MYEKTNKNPTNNPPNKFMTFLALIVMRTRASKGITAVISATGGQRIYIFNLFLCDTYTNKITSICLSVCVLQLMRSVQLYPEG